MIGKFFRFLWTIVGLITVTNLCVERCHAQTLQVRKNIASFSDTELQSLRNGIAIMKARPASDPTSWAFQAAIHGTMTGTNPLFNQCEHGTNRFLPWHRAYLYYFERILRKASGDPNLTLPYWDWSNQRALPKAFRIPSGTDTNPLFDGTREMNDGSLLPLEVVQVDMNTALSRTVFSTPFGGGFSDLFQNSPHGAVHVFVGGNMSSVPTSANDPIFWLHHCNIDRQWDAWLNMDAGRLNPTDVGFLNFSYKLVDENGQTVNFKVRDVISSSKLGYQYDGVPNPPVLLAAGEPESAPGAAPSFKTVASSETPGLESSSGTFPLGLKSTNVKLNLQAGGLESLHAAAAAAKPSDTQKLRVVVEGIEFAAVPSYSYGIYLNLPPEETSESRTRLHYLGTINFFGKGHGHTEHGGHDEAKASFDASYDASETIARLRENDRWNTNELAVTIRPLTTTPPAGKEAEQAKQLESSAEKAKVAYKRVVLQVAE
jgi:hypothetical protein